ncbi:MAG: hypothetical protein HOE90_19460 [Bacteriovoracaceae bacterium]|nr:hypothetical protein [Bacteriovoracaceae bacterium]
MDNNEEIYFSLVIKREALRRFAQLEEESTELKLWKKNASERIKFSVSKFNSEEIILELITSEKTKITNEKVLFNFVVEGVQYFGSGKIEKSKYIGNFTLKPMDKLYKCERRKGYRLLVYPLHEVFAEIDLNEMISADSRKILDITQKKVGTETDLFKKFHFLLGQTKKNIKNSIFPFRAINVSSLGLALKLGEFEASFFSEGIEFRNLVIKFNGGSFPIEWAKVVYIQEYSEKGSSAITSYKVGLEFLKIDENVEKSLTRTLNHEMKESDFTLEFELFEG